MKKFTTLTVAALFCLAACNKGPNEITYEQYKEKADALSGETYKSASVSYEVGEQKGTIEYTYTNGEWTTNSNDALAEQFVDSLGQEAKNAIKEMNPKAFDENNFAKFYDDLSIYLKMTVDMTSMIATLLPIDLGDFSYVIVTEGTTRFNAAGVFVSTEATVSQTYANIPEELKSTLEQAGITEGTTTTRSAYSVTYSK